MAEGFPGSQKPSECMNIEQRCHTAESDMVGLSLVVPSNPVASLQLATDEEEFRVMRSSRRWLQLAG
jgi:hypothetical protein